MGQPVSAPQEPVHLPRVEVPLGFVTGMLGWENAAVVFSVVANGFFHFKQEFRRPIVLATIWRISPSRIQHVDLVACPRQPDVVLLCDFSFPSLFRWSPSWPWSAWWECAGGCMPMIDACLLATPQRAIDHVRDLFLPRHRRPQQGREDRPYLRHRHRRCFFPRRSLSNWRNHNASSDSVMW